MTARGRIWLRRATLCAAVAVLVASLTLAASAGNEGTWWNGGGQNKGSSGVSGSIDSAPVKVFRDVSIWMAVGGPNGEDYIQAGWGRSAGQTENWHFYEWSSSSTGTYLHKEPYKAAEGAHTYKVELGSDNVWYVYIDGAKQTYTVKHDDLKWAPSRMRFMGEVHDDADDQSPGTTSNPVVMGSLQYKSGTTWSNVQIDYIKTTDTLPHQKNNLTKGVAAFKQWDSRY